MRHPRLTRDAKWLLLVATVSQLALNAMATQTHQPVRLAVVPMHKEPPRKPLKQAELDALRKKVAEKPTDRAARFDLIKVLMTSGKLTEALVEARKWRKKDAYNLVVVRLIGDIYSELGQKLAARRAYSAVVELLPEDPAAHRALATVLKQSGDLAGAYARLKVALGLRPKDLRIAFELADLAHRLGRTKEAVQRLLAITKSEAAPRAIAYASKQRLAQVYSSWRRDALSANDAKRAAELSGLIAALQVKGGGVNDIKIYLTWDTDRSDVDLWVITPSGEQISYKHKQGKDGEALFDDVTTGYGPESFTAPRAQVGTYIIKVHYYNTNRRAFTEARGEVVVILNEGTARETRHVLPYRLFKVKELVTVGKITVGR